MPIDLNSTKIDHHDAKLATMLQNLQGNILKDHGRDHSVHTFLAFTASGAPRQVLGARTPDGNLSGAAA